MIFEKIEKVKKKNNKDWQFTSHMTSSSMIVYMSHQLRLGEYTHNILICHDCAVTNVQGFLYFLINHHSWTLFTLS